VKELRLINRQLDNSLVRMLIPIADRGMKNKPSETEIKVFSEYRVHNVTLARFVIAAISY
jgi:hypothetical protein